MPAPPATLTPMGTSSSFLLEFLRDPRSTAAIAPSSRRLAERMVEGIDFPTVRSIVEYGPGTGVFTRAVLERCRQAPREDRVFLAVEKNQRLAERLAASEPGVRVHHGDALEIDRLCADAGLDGVDFVLSGLGWPSLPAPVREGILERTATLLRPGGEFRTFGYHIGLLMRGAWEFRRTVRRLFREVTISPVVWGNLPPAFVYRCVR
jgi:phosphatidylethanolamine/phosphatidyl-N-methylethanolamine N-methyltransferase